MGGLVAAARGFAGFLGVMGEGFAAVLAGAGELVAVAPVAVVPVAVVPIAASYLGAAVPAAAVPAAASYWGSYLVAEAGQA